MAARLSPLLPSPLSLTVPLAAPAHATAATAHWTKFSLTGIGAPTESGRAADRRWQAACGLGAARRTQRREHPFCGVLSGRQGAESRSRRSHGSGSMLHCDRAFGRWRHPVFNGDQDTKHGQPVLLGRPLLGDKLGRQHLDVEPGSLSQHTALNSTIAATTASDGSLVTAQALNHDLYVHSAPTPRPLPRPPTSTFPRRSGRTSRHHSWYALLMVPSGWVGSRPSAPTRATGCSRCRRGGGSCRRRRKLRREPDEQSGPAGGIGRPSSGRGVLAYCEPTATAVCAKIGLWRVGAAKAAVVPGSTAGAQVTLSNGPGGRLVIGWYATADCQGQRRLDESQRNEVQ